MKGNRDEEVEGMGIPITPKSFNQLLSKERGEVVFLFILPPMDRLSERPFVIPQSPCHCKISSSGQTSAAVMGIDLLGEKWNPTERANRWLNPTDLRKAIRAESLLILL